MSKNLSKKFRVLEKTNQIFAKIFYMFENFTIETLKESPSFYKEVIAGIEESFHYNGFNKATVDFYPLLNKDNFKNLFILKDKNTDKLIGHIGVKQRDLVLNGKFYPVTLLGGIFIKKEYQGKGIFNFFFQEVLEIFKEKSGLYILWSDLSELYKKFGFFQAGTLIQTGHKKLQNLESFIQKPLNEINDREFLEIKELYKKKIEEKLFTFHRSQKDWNEIVKINSSKVFMAKNRDGHIECYFIKDKGQDLQNVIHEFVYSSDFEHKYLKKLIPYRLWLSEKHSHLSETCLYTALFKIGDLSMFKEFIYDWSFGEVSLHELNDTEIKIKYQDNVHTMTYNEFFTGIFGPGRIEEFAQYGKPIYFSGLDSI